MTDRSESVRQSGIVWCPADFSRGGLVAGLPDDLEPRLLEPGQPATFSADEAGGLLLDGPVDDLRTARVDSARRAPGAVGGPSGTPRPPAWPPRGPDPPPPR